MKRILKEMPVFVKGCALVLLLILFLTLFADVFMPYDPDANQLLKRNQAPVFAGGDASHWLGTDELGRDLYSRVLFGGRISISMAVFGLLVGGTVGVVLGLTAGYFGGHWDRFIIMLVNFQQSIPFTLIILLGIILFGRTIPVLMVFIGLARWETYTRFIRSVVLSLKQRNYVKAAKVYNASSARIIFKYIFPEVIPYFIVLLTLNFPSVLMLESSLSFIGVGVQPPTATLGQMVGSGRNYLTTNPWISVIPAIVIVLLSYSVHHVGEWIRDRMDVRLRRMEAGQ